jgi:hypothetical protein
MILCFLCPRDHHKWMTLQGPEADGRHPHPKVDSLPGFDIKWLWKLYADPDRAIFVSNIGLRTTVTKNTVSADDHVPLGNAHEQKQPCRDIKVHAGEGFLGGQFCSSSSNWRFKSSTLSARHTHGDHSRPAGLENLHVGIGSLIRAMESNKEERWERRRTRERCRDWNFVTWMLHIIYLTEAIGVGDFSASIHIVNSPINVV